MSNPRRPPARQPRRPAAPAPRGRAVGAALPGASMREHPPFEVRCPLHGSIPFDEPERRVIDHPLVQRLRYISQLGFAALVYPGATHSRFSHSLGVMHLAGAVFDRIAEASPALAAAGYGPDALAYCRRIVRLAGLLHDVGHAPFSHSFEPLLPARAALPLPWDWYAPAGRERGAQARHEDFSVAAVCALAREAPALLDEAEARDICALIDGRIVPGAALRGGKGRPAVYPLLKQIISGEIDADRMDYLRRDAHFAGVTYGLFDLSRLIQSLSCTAQREGLVMTLDHSALYTYENFLMARFHMAMQVYFHKTLLPFEHFLKRAMEEGEIDFRINGTLDNFLAAREDRVLDALHRAHDRRWAGRIVHRRPLARLLQLEQLEAGDGLRERVMAAVEALRGEGVEVIHLREERPLSTLGAAASDGAAPLYVAQSVLGRASYRPLQEVSVLLERYNQVFTIEGLYCDPADYDRAAAALGPIVAPPGASADGGLTP
jgi:uncharacterized protein